MVGINIWSECFSQPLSDYYPEEEGRDVLRIVGLLTAQPFDTADFSREIHHTHSPGNQQILLSLIS
jgi:hypothetical protein